MNYARKWIFILGLCVLASAIPGLAQRVTSDILGTVEDTSGAAIAGAKVTVTHVETGITQETVSDASGSYDVPGLEPGTYEVHVEHAGFKTVLRRGLVVLVNEQVVVNVTLEIGAIQQRVEVTAKAPVVETRTGYMSNVVTERVLSELPLNGRDVFQLTELQTGVLQTTNAGPNPWSEGGIPKRLSRVPGQR